MTEIESIFEYEKLLEDAKKYFMGREVNSKSIEEWFFDIGLSKYIHYPIVEKLMFKLRQDLWKFF